MRKIDFKNARFTTSASQLKALPTLKADSGELFQEVAVAGRSNVGKSSLLNHLFEKRDLVKTSSVPGKTQLLNFFTVDDALVFVDLPGYGYAKVPHGIRQEWGPLIQGYLGKRPQLKLILFLFDIRRLPNEEDKMFLEWAAKNEKALILVLTKTDKVTRTEQITNTRKILEAFNCGNLHHIHYSAVKNIGRKELIAMMVDALDDEQST